MPIAHVTFGTNQLDAGLQFYDAVIGAMGGARAFTTERAAGWGFGEGGGPSIGITLPFDGHDANVGNGTMAAIMVGDEECVRRVHAAALDHGGSCEGAPGLRANGFYAAYFRDPDGNKMNAFCVPAAGQ